MSSLTLTKAVRLIDRVLMVLAALGLLAMMLHICLDVLSGLLLNAPIAVTSAYVTNYYMIAVAFLPLAAADYREAHIGVDLFTKRLPRVPQRWLGIAVLALCLAVYAGLAIQSWQQAVAKFAVDEFLMEQTTRVSIWPSFFMLPLAFGVAALLVALKLVLTLVGKPELALHAAPAEEAVLERFHDV